MYNAPIIRRIRVSAKEVAGDSRRRTLEPVVVGLS